MIASRCSSCAPVGRRALIGASLTRGAALFPDCAPRCFVPATTPSTARCLGTFCIGGMSSKARAPWNQDCSPVLSTIPLSLSQLPPTSPSDGSPGRQGASLFSTLFVSLWLRSGPECCCPISWILAHRLRPPPKAEAGVFNSAILSEPSGTSASSRWQRFRHSMRQD